MNDYLEIFEKFKDVKEIFDFINDVTNLRFYFRASQFQKMQEHINSLTLKYPIETLVWNTVNSNIPTSYKQAYKNADMFLQLQGAKILVKNVANYKQYLFTEEVAYIESLINNEIYY